MYLDGLAQRLHAVTEEAGGVEVVQAAVRAYQASLMMSRACPEVVPIGETKGLEPLVDPCMGVS